MIACDERKMEGHAAHCVKVQSLQQTQCKLTVQKPKLAD